jgi:DNA-directed RNA polymerase sigma subunit (sigma70/sigma32)
MENPLLTEDPDLRQVWRWIADCLWRLPQRERRVIMRRYGYVDGDIWTLERTAKELGLSRQRVRQIERDAETMLVRLCSRPDSKAEPPLSLLRRNGDVES